MGQAKKRGSQTQRVAEAAARLAALTPTFLKCNYCSEEIHDVVALSSRGMAGIDATFGAHCPSCGRDTYALKGTAAAVARFGRAIAAHGMSQGLGAPLLSVQEG